MSSHRTRPSLCTFSIPAVSYMASSAAMRNSLCLRETSRTLFAFIPLLAIGPWNPLGAHTKPANSPDATHPTSLMPNESSILDAKNKRDMPDRSALGKLWDDLLIEQLALQVFKTVFRSPIYCMEHELVKFS